ncbi:MAG TPA: hypothetical protein VJN67_03175 [Stellaceae bacterium]|nr:hypothetical protein [Stellaceae bacterium]
MSSLSTPAPAALPAPPTSVAGTVRLLTAYLVLVTLALSPLYWASVPPLVDYPNHLARMWILAQNGALPELASNYSVDWRVLPDLAMDLVVPPLTQILPLEIAGRIFIALTLLSLLAGTVVLHRTLQGRVGFWPLAALLFLYNAAVFWGFLSCLFGIGIFLLAFSGWVASRHWRSAPRIALFGTVATALFFLHLFAFCLYGLAVGSYECGLRLAARERPLRGFLRLCATSLQFVPGLALWIASLPKAGPRYMEYGDLGAKVYAVQAPFTFGPQAIALDKVFLIFCLGFTATAIAARALRLAPEMRLTLSAMILAAAAMPNWASGSWLADIRLPVALPFVLIASTRVEVARLRAAGWFAAVALVLLGVRVWAISETWRDADRLFVEFRSAARVIAPGARLLIVDDTPRGGRPFGGVPSFIAERWDESFPQLPALAVIDRAAFIPYLFTGWTSVAAAPRNAGLSQTQAVPLTSEALRRSARVEPGDPAYERPDFLGERPYWGNWPQHFDFVLWIGFGSIKAPDSVALQPLAEGSYFRIYRVAPPPS